MADDVLADFFKAFEERQRNITYIPEFPLEVSGVKMGNMGVRAREDKVGSWVMIRPCAKEYDNKTFVGVYVGDIPIEGNYCYNKETKELEVFTRTNPAIFVPELQKIIFGCESWWGPINSPEDLEQITDRDIQNIWYVKALKAMSESKEVEDDEE